MQMTVCLTFVPNVLQLTDLHTKFIGPIKPESNFNDSTLNLTTTNLSKIQISKVI